MPDAFPHGTVHRAGDDLQVAIRADPAILALWQGLTPLGRNEFICWVDDAKQAATRARRIRRTREELQEGKRRPCCVHRTDKPPSPFAASATDRPSARRLTISAAPPSAA